jgi:hypothetical protein
MQFETVSKPLRFAFSKNICKSFRNMANDKTIVIVFSRGRQSTNLKFTLNGSELEIVNEFNYLGILFNRTGHFNKTIKKQAEKAPKAMFEVLHQFQ